MRPKQAAVRNGRPRWARLLAAVAGGRRLGAPVRLPQRVRTRGVAIWTSRNRAAALRTHDEIRSATGGIPSRDTARADASARGEIAETLKMSLPLDDRAAGAARIAVERLRGRIASSVLEDARLVVSELVTNSVRHSGAATGELVDLDIQISEAIVRLEVRDPGCGGVIARRTPDLDGGGLGLNIVDALSVRWGFERTAAGGMRVWAHLPRAPSLVATSR